MTMRFFATPQDAEAAFYEALERADLDAMMATWAEDEDVLCVHPGGERIAGFAAVRESWRRIFVGGPRISVRLSGAAQRQGILLALRSAHEHYSLPGETRPRLPVIASHVYVRGPRGWHLLSRHASSAPAPPAGDVPTVLH
ncbi:MAG: nuclear transport factor 2 family protein [Zoogloeaceae bacterium]|jgi:ketosteroid isomerase-like protein|nr:nuclear transport factor 2 family protein [Zoogloeaceae bacterium]